jgi:hypothetical protein
MEHFSKPNEAPDAPIVEVISSLVLLSFKWKLALT